MKKANILKNENGITLIALIVTIIVLLILSMIAIKMITGSNGLMDKSVEAKLENDKAEIKEIVEMEVLASYKNGEINWSVLENNINENIELKSDITPKNSENVENGITFDVEKNGKTYNVEIDEDGEVTVEFEGISMSSQDKIPPTVKLNIKTRTINTADVSVVASDDEEETSSGLARKKRYTYYINGVKQGQSTMSETFTFTNLQKNEQNEIKVEVKDNAGNVGTDTLVIRRSELFGDLVNYNVDLNDNKKNDDDWKIFYIDNNYTYLIASEYLLSSKVPDIGMKDQTSHGAKYGLRWENVPLTTLSSIPESVFKEKYFTFDLKNTTNGAKCAASLLNTASFNSFIGAHGEEAIGSPTIELLLASWNEKYPDKIQNVSQNENGYIGTVTLSTSDTLYVLPNNSGTSAYWLASPSGTEGSSQYPPSNWVMMCISEGRVGSAVHYRDNVSDFTSIRPVIRLKANIDATKKNNIWQFEE